jgi:hypothetical protein
VCGVYIGEYVFDREYAWCSIVESIQRVEVEVTEAHLVVYVQVQNCHGPMPSQSVCDL